MKGIRALTLAVLLGATSLGLQGCGAEDAFAGSGGNGSSSGGDIVTLTPQSPNGTDGSVTVSWIPPTQRQDGTPLEIHEISEYRVHYGYSSGNYTGLITVPDEQVWETEIRDTSPGERVYVVVEAVDDDGLVSGYSEEVSLLVN